MSLDTLRWALKANPGNASRKLVLISLADRAGETHEAFPSAVRLERDTCLNLKTVKKCLRELAELGFIEDTGRRVGDTGRVVVWRLLDVSGREDEPVDKRPKKGSIKSTQKRTDSKVIDPNFPSNEPKNGTIKSTQKRVAEPPIVLTTQENHPASCSDLAAATPSPLEEIPPDDSPGRSPTENTEALSGDLVPDADQVVPGWTFAKLLDPPEQDPERGTFIGLPLRSDQVPPVYFVTDQQILEYQGLFPGIDVADECRIMLAWLLGNPGKRKTTSGMPKFITGWLTRAKTTGGSPYRPAVPNLVGYEKAGHDPKAKRENVRQALRDIHNTDW